MKTSATVYFFGKLSKLERLVQQCMAGITSLSLIGRFSLPSVRPLPVLRI